MKRTSTLVLFGTLVLVGCENMGLDYAGPADEAGIAPPSELVAAGYGPSTASRAGRLIVDGRLWMPSEIPPALDEENVRAVGSANGQTVYARSWDRAPYDRLFTRLAEPAPTGPAVFGIAEGAAWRSHLPVIGGDGPAGGAGGH